LSVVEEQISHILAYINTKNNEKVAGVKGLEPSTYRVTGDRSNQLSYTPTLIILVGSKGLEPLTPSV
jgi:hypothetical protein